MLSSCSGHKPLVHEWMHSSFHAPMQIKRIEETVTSKSSSKANKVVKTFQLIQLRFNSLMYFLRQFLGNGFP